MSTLYIDHTIARIQREGESIALHTREERRGNLPLRQIERVIIRGNVTLDSGLLAHLADSGIGILILGGRFGEKCATLHGSPHADAKRRLAQSRAYFDPEWRLHWSQRLTTLKLLSQQRLLQQAQRQRPDLRHPLLQGEKTLQQTAHQAPHAATLERLRGLEGAGAAAYFQAYRQLFPASLHFTQRNRRPPRDPVNALLSLGYTLLHHDAERAIQQAGLDPLIGFYHVPAYNRASLAADFIEPLRARFDRLAWTLFRERTLRLEHFAINAEGCLLDKTGRKIFYGHYEAWGRGVRRLLLRHAYRLTAQLLERYPLEEDDAA